MDVRLTIITISYNNLQELKKTCLSVNKQQVLPFEHIIVDGSSNPDIKNWLANSQQPTYRSAISEPDKGIADAFNKGIAMAQGNLLLMLNSADELADETTLATVLAIFERDNKLMWLHGMYKYQRAGMWVTLGKPFEPGKIYRGMRSICHQTMYVRKELHEKYGMYDTKLKISMDFDFLVRIRNEKFLFLPKVLAIFSPGGTSMQNAEKILAENTAILKNYIGISWVHKIWTIRLLLLIKLLNTPFGKRLYSIKKKLGLANA